MPQNIDKVGWIRIQDRKVLFVMSKGKDLFYFPGGKREGAESDAETLIREIKEELNVDIISSTIKYLTTFKVQAHGQKEGIFVETKYYTADYIGDFKPMTEIEELAWFSSNETQKITEMGKLTLSWLKNNDLID
jgi:8-oxo-dGTP pyrophosphatase MutT (NUDIX family)